MPQASAAGHVMHFVALTNRAASASPRAAPPLSRPVHSAARAPAPKPANDRQDFRAGVRQERRRWATVLGSKAFLCNPILAAHLLADSSQPAAAIIKTLRQASADAAAAVEMRKAAVDEGWKRAFARASAQSKPSTERPSLDAAFARAGSRT